MSKTVVIYWSGTGNTESMAKAVFNGASAVNTQSELFSVSDISAESASEYDNLILGCPAMGAEVLEENEFEPFFCELENKLNGKNVALFGSYGWGDGEWMRNWTERVQQSGATLLNDGLITPDAPDNDILEQCRALGEKMAAL